MPNDSLPIQFKEISISSHRYDFKFANVGDTGAQLFDRCCNHDKATVNALGQVPYNDWRKAGVDNLQNDILNSRHNRLGADGRPLMPTVGNGTDDLRSQADKIRLQAAYGVIGQLDADNFDPDALRLLQKHVQQRGQHLDANVLLGQLEGDTRITKNDVTAALREATESETSKRGGSRWMSNFNDAMTVDSNKRRQLNGGTGRDENNQTLGAIFTNRTMSNATREMLQESVENRNLNPEILARMLNNAGMHITYDKAMNAVNESREKYSVFDQR